MAELHLDVKNWLHKQPDWLQRAAEIILSKVTLDDADINLLVEHLKTAVGQGLNGSRAFNEITTEAAQFAEVRLKSIGGITGIENLGPRTPLDFGTGNLCVIYGNNGSGKSGYSRLIKKAAGKPLAKDLKHNVFQPAPAENQRKATLAYLSSGTAQEKEWIANSAPIDALQAIDIFDADTATNYLTKESEASYTPPLVTLFVRLAEMCELIKVKLQQQQGLLVSSKPALPLQFSQTRAGAQYNGLNALTLPTDLQKLQEWNDAEELSLIQLVERLATADPAALARQKRATKGQLEQIVTGVKTVASEYTGAALDVIRTLREAVRAKRKIAKEAAQVASAKLDGVGTETWKALWEAARSYSQTAYPEREFPVVENARCVLCHQELASDAQQRLQDFENFVRGDVEQAATDSESDYKTALEQLPTAQTEESIVQSCQSAGVDDEALVEDFKAFWKDIALLHTTILGEEKKDVALAVVAPQKTLKVLEERIASLEAQAQQHDQDVTGFDRVEATQRRTELEAKKWISTQATAITAEMERLKKSVAFEKWIALTNTRQITEMGSRVAEAAITEAYVTRFNAELAALKAKRIKVRLVKTRATKAKSYHKLQLENSLDGSATPDQVLSEGERRIISLAAFLADVVDKPNASTFIFDDPVSSLDQEFELAVASRMVQLAKSRQVLVFTHRLSLVAALEDASEKMGEAWEKQHLVQKWIETFSGVSGQVALESARNANPKKANNIILDRLREAKQKGEQEGSNVYKNLAAGLCSEVRILLERTVEQDLLGKIVLRNRASITTDNKLGRLATIKLEDCSFIDGLMTKYSTLVHSQSTENPMDIPEEPELRKDLEDLKNWRDEFEKRAVPGVASA